MTASVAERTPAQFFALVFGTVLFLAGVLGFFYNASFAAGDALEREALLGVLDVNAWHNLVHLATGGAGLAAMRSYAGARLYSLALGVTYSLVALLGFLVGTGEAILGLVPVNTEDNVLHLLIAISALAAYAATPAVPAPTTTKPT